MSPLPITSLFEGFCVRGGVTTLVVKLSLSASFGHLTRVNASPLPAPRSPSGESILSSLTEAFQALWWRAVHIVMDIPVQRAAFAA